MDMEQRTLARVLVGCGGDAGARMVHTIEAAGLEAVAAYTDQDADVPYLDDAAYAVHVASYAEDLAVLSGALDAGADAVHPGTSPLSRDGTFAQMVHNVGLLWIGARLDLLDRDRVHTRHQARTIGVEPLATSPTLSGPEEALLWLQRLGPPLRWKGPRAPSRRIDTITVGQQILADASAYPSIIERAIPDARHIVMIVVGDGQGNAIHILEHERSLLDGERVVVRECPSPAVSPALREQLGDAAARYAQELRYLGVGAVEFLLDAQGRFWFYDFIPGLPEGFPLHDLVAGVDLVGAQLALAQEEGLGWDQLEIETGRYAIELSLLATAAGEVEDVVLPEDLDGTPLVIAGQSVAAQAPLLTFRVQAPTRHAALVRARVQLAAVQITGVPHNREQLSGLLAQPAFWEGRQISTL